MTDVVEALEVQVLVEEVSSFVLEPRSDETTISVDGEVHETLVIYESEVLHELEPTTELLEVATQGPPGVQGPPGSGTSYPSRTLVYTGPLITEVLSYSDAGKTQLAQRKVLSYSGAQMQSIQFFDGVGTLVKTRTLTYNSGALTGYSDA